MTRINLSALSKYVEAHGKIYVYAKGDMLARQGHVCRHIGIVKSGYFKYVTLNSKGQEVATGFSFEGEVVTDYVHSFLCDRPSLTSIVAGCDAEVLCAPIDELRRYLLVETPGFVANASSNLLQEAYRRYLDCLVKTPTERFRELVARLPGVTQNLPIQEIASYLGVSRRQLHRIREAESAADNPEI